MRLIKQLSVLSCFVAVTAIAYQLRPSLAVAGGSACFAVGSDFNGPSTRKGVNSHQQILIGASEFTMGTNNGYPEELPAHAVSVGEFWIDIHEVTNKQFAAFVDATGYVTTAEIKPDPEQYPQIPPESLVAGSASFVKLDDRPKGQWRDWWKFIEGANWRQPSGPGSDLKGRDHYPVVHVSYQDALSYANWVGTELPTEAQWELAAQASAELKEANTWQGYFPLQDKALDGFDGVAPVGCYTADSNGLFDMKGNVWELVQDVFDSPEHDANLAPMRVIKGGSYLCSDNFCQRDRPQARQGQEEDFSTDHVGFRTVSTQLSSAVNNQ